jgi:hypothetical protein
LYERSRPSRERTTYSYYTNSDKLCSTERLPSQMRITWGKPVIVTIRDDGTAVVLTVVRAVIAGLEALALAFYGTARGPLSLDFNKPLTSSVPIR